MRGTCLYCNKSTVVYPIKSWNDENVTRHYCEKHFQEVKSFDEEEKRRFWEYYRSLELRQECLSEKSRALWVKIDEEFGGI